MAHIGDRPGVLFAKRLICGNSKVLIKELPKEKWWQFVDYSWDCVGCGGMHCSSCEYHIEDDSIVVYHCGRFRLPK